MFSGNLTVISSNSSDYVQVGLFFKSENNVASVYLTLLLLPTPITIPPLLPLLLLLLKMKENAQQNPSKSAVTATITISIAGRLSAWEEVEETTNCVVVVVVMAS